MPRPRPMPESLRQGAFRRRDLEPLRISQGRLNRPDVANPYHGVHAAAPPSTVQEHCAAYLVRMRPGQAFSHATAALLHGMPLPERLEPVQPLHVCCVRPASPPRTRNVVGHRLTVPPAVQDLDGLPVCVPSEVWCQLAPELSLDELIEVADHLLTVSPAGPEKARTILAARIAATRRANADLLTAALDEARWPVRSPGETRVRLLLVRAGVREPTLNDGVTDASGTVLGHADLVWRPERLVLEYEGDDHRVDKRRFRRDIDRYEAFRDAGWEVIRATGDDLIGWKRERLVRRVQARLARRR